jgi:hypothetical protein
MITDLMLLVSPFTMSQIKAGQVVEVATHSKLATTSKCAAVRESTSQAQILFVDVTYSHTHFGRHFIFLSLPSAPMQVSLAEDVAQKGAVCK